MTPTTADPSCSASRWVPSMADQRQEDSRWDGEPERDAQDDPRRSKRAITGTKDERGREDGGHCRHRSGYPVPLIAEPRERTELRGAHRE